MNIIKKKIWKFFLPIFLGIVFFTAEKIFAQWNPDGDLGTTGLPEAPVYDIIENILLWLLGIVGIVAMIGFVISGIMYLTSAGDEKKMGTAKNAMTYSIIGVVVALSGFVVLQAVTLMLGGSSPRF